ncbi:GNAT family acetyltransferase [Halotalea alkalilenta]|uniref:GNAT family acetyltransferase n=1 Tax=Halotalea alkalilenta TaxID=376489 RepID=UPI000693A0B2|nr:GNAT family acetyltransferase [Halotalea alkalilenta]
MPSRFAIRPFETHDTEAVVALWRRAGLTRPWNDPYLDIQRKLDEDPTLFLIIECEGHPVASAMFGYDGHRGWLYYLAVEPSLRGRGHARALIEEGERLLLERGCPKLHLMVRRENAQVIELYRHLGYAEVETVTLGKRLIEDTPTGIPSADKD